MPLEPPIIVKIPGYMWSRVFVTPAILSALARGHRHIRDPLNTRGETMLHPLTRADANELINTLLRALSMEPDANGIIVPYDAPQPPEAPPTPRIALSEDPDTDFLAAWERELLAAGSPLGVPWQDGHRFSRVEQTDPTHPDRVLCRCGFSGDAHTDRDRGPGARHIFAPHPVLTSLCRCGSSTRTELCRPN